MVDLHTHILPGMDDGSKSIRESISMLQEQVRQGVTQIVLTPHFYAYENSPEEFLRRRAASYERLRCSLPARMPELHLGAEVQYFEGICQMENIHTLCVDGNSVLLLEMPFRPWTSRTVMDVVELSRRADLQIILAHVERYSHWAPKEVWPLLRRSGVLMQSNADYFLDWKTRRKAVQMYRNGEIHFIASDCHNMTTRPPNLGKAMAYIQSRTRS